MSPYIQPGKGQGMELYYFGGERARTVLHKGKAPQILVLSREGCNDKIGDLVLTGKLLIVKSHLRGGGEKKKRKHLGEVRKEKEPSCYYPRNEGETLQ